MSLSNWCHDGFQDWHGECELHKSLKSAPPLPLPQPATHDLANAESATSKFATPATTTALLAVLLRRLKARLVQNHATIPPAKGHHDHKVRS